ncbi:hypothetical protein EVAR_28130_1 [Eumeta japonica]|uniref:Uncharacterized protein n=1 Tax=Eumeta variegata TaxID=151549 RepID=A0A4C1VDW6_EUMVA|nr:hypothetical protein EVAR_28130_1 [Eumeta japonica]
MPGPADSARGDTPGAADAFLLRRNTSSACLKCLTLKITVNPFCLQGKEWEYGGRGAGGRINGQTNNEVILYGFVLPLEVRKSKNFVDCRWKLHQNRANDEGSTRSPRPALIIVHSKHIGACCSESGMRIVSFSRGGRIAGRHRRRSCSTFCGD